jgi:hypothetical protein
MMFTSSKLAMCWDFYQVIKNKHKRYLSRKESEGLQPSLSLTSICLLCNICGNGGLHNLYDKTFNPSIVLSLKVTNAKPLLLPVVLSFIIATSTTVPYYEKYSSMSCSK